MRTRRIRRAWLNRLPGSQRITSHMPPAKNTDTARAAQLDTIEPTLRVRRVGVLMGVDMGKRSRTTRYGHTVPQGTGHLVSLRNRVDTRICISSVQPVINQ